MLLSRPSLFSRGITWACLKRFGKQLSMKEQFARCAMSSEYTTGQAFLTDVGIDSTGEDNSNKIILYKMVLFLKQYIRYYVGDCHWAHALACVQRLCIGGYNYWLKSLLLAAVVRAKLYWQHIPWSSTWYDSRNSFPIAIFAKNKLGVGAIGL